ncbi:MAG TPA: FkbM family methyltransferase [Burkholderiales bacterium]|nr:FkbM family methyltransferase [Burkholderiales bacterium]
MRDLLSFFALEPVLVDVGASAGPPHIWAPIAANSTYVGFDPDARAMTDAAQGIYRKTIIVNEAVTSDSNVAEVRFYLTRSPVCSSTLEPDAAALSNYHFHALFETEREAMVRASTLDAILLRLGLGRVDWLKCDTQGTDLRIFRSLGDKLQRGVLALDVEPGLIDVYRGEDLFVDAHKHAVANGFWLSRLDVQGAVRVRDASLQAVFRGAEDLAACARRAIRGSPGWCEARYLRTVEFLAESDAARDQYALLWLFSLLDDQPGFALDVALDYERRFGGDAWSERMRKEATLRIVRGQRFAVLTRAKSWVRRVAGWPA